MAWISQQYGAEVHVVPDHEPAGTSQHVLSGACWCEPRLADPIGVWTHRDEADRLLGDKDQELER